MQQQHCLGQVALALMLRDDTDEIQQYAARRTLSERLKVKGRLADLSGGDLSQVACTLGCPIQWSSKTQHDLPAVSDRSILLQKQAQ